VGLGGFATNKLGLDDFRMIRHGERRLVTKGLDYISDLKYLSVNVRGTQSF